MKDVLLLHVGQCGIQQGAKLIETLTIEHNISETGKLQKMGNRQNVTHGHTKRIDHRRTNASSHVAISIFQKT